MENRSKKNSIDLVIYILIAAMLVGMVAVSVFTVVSRRSRQTPVDSIPEADTTDGETEITSPDSGDAETKKPDGKKPEAVTSQKNTETKEQESASVNKPTEVPTSTGIRYYVIPVDGAVSKAFEIDIPVYSLTMNDYRAHTGVDLAAAVGSEVICVAGGNICRVWNDPMMGKCVSVDHGDSIVSTYMNLSEELASGIEVGAKVLQGQPLGAVGETSLVEIAEEPHLHLEMKVNGKVVDPIEFMGIEAVGAVYED